MLLLQPTVPDESNDTLFVEIVQFLIPFQFIVRARNKSNFYSTTKSYLYLKMRHAYLTT